MEMHMRPSALAPSTNSVAQALLSQEPPQGPAAPATPFVWGAGGRRMTPAEIELARQAAQRQMATGADFSPVQSWTQGLARIATGLVGALHDRDSRRAADANAADTNRIAQLLVQGGTGDAGGPSRRDAIVEALLNPYVGDQMHAVAGKVLDQEYEAGKPQYFTAGNDRAMFNPRTGQTEVLYHGQSDAEDYATSLGLQRGTPEFNTAMQDYVLRANGPTAYGYDVDLEGVRQDNREQLEGVRQRNRLSLRQTPTYGQTHPRPSSGGGGRPRTPTMSGTMAPILAKVARGEQLTAAEQRAWSMYRPGRGGPGGGSVRQPSSGGRTATDPKTGKKVQWNGKAWVPIG